MVSVHKEVTSSGRQNFTEQQYKQIFQGYNNNRLKF